MAKQIRYADTSPSTSGWLVDGLMVSIAGNSRPFVCHGTVPSTDEDEKGVCAGTIRLAPRHRSRKV